MTSPSVLRNTEKAKLFVEWMEGDHVLVHLDATRENVEVPAHLKDNPSLTLALSYHFQGETTSDENGIESYLRFRGTYHRCILPWDAIWGMTKPDSENRLWPEDLPATLVAKLGADIAKRTTVTAKGEPVKTITEKVTPVVSAAESKPEEGSCSGERPKPVLTRIK